MEQSSSERMETAEDAKIVPEMKSCDTDAMSDTKPRHTEMECGNKTDTVCTFYLQGKCRFGDECRNAHPKDCTTTCMSPKTKKLQKVKKKVKAVEDDISVRKPSMKTAENVISRILWDEKLPEECFTIGYLDRFKGILEKPFIFFSWEDIASVNNYVFAIPKHRIQYFKYRGFKVWDKNERLDFIFGSTGNEPDIYNYMMKIDTDLENNPEAEIFIEREPSDDECGKDVSKPTENAECIIHPSHFICVRITDPDIIKTASIVKQYVNNHEPCYSNYFIADDCLHVTIALMKLDMDEIPTAVEIFETMWDSMQQQSLEDAFELQISGLDTFGRRVLYGKIDCRPNFLDFATESLNMLREAGLRIVSNHAFNPHMTLWKSDKTLKREKRYIEPLLYKSHSDSYFGVQLVNNLHFCVIGEEKAEDGFYKCLMSKTL